MAKDVIITPLSGLVDFQSSSTSQATIELDDSNNLKLSSSGGTVQIGNASSDVYIGTGAATVDIIFQQDGSVRGTGTETICLGLSGDNIVLPSGVDLSIGTTSTAQNATTTHMGNMSFGLPGNGANTCGRFISIEGNADSSGEGSGRIFFTEHNSTTASMSKYGMSIGYRGGGVSVTGADGNVWCGLNQIGNGQWGMWGHDNSLDGSLIMYGDRAATFVCFNNNNVCTSGGMYAGQYIDRDNTSCLVNPSATSYLNSLCVNAGLTSGDVYICSSTNSWNGGLMMESQDGTDIYCIHPDNNGYMYVNKNWCFNDGDLKFGKSNPYICAPSYIIMPGGLYVSGGTAYFSNATMHRGGVCRDNATYLQISGGTGCDTYFPGQVGIGTTDPGTSKLFLCGTGVASQPLLGLSNTSSSTYIHSLEAFAPNLASTQTNLLVVGKSATTKNSGYLGYYWTSDASNSNFVSIGHWSSDHRFRVYADGTTCATLNLNVGGSLCVGGNSCLGNGNGDWTHVNDKLHVGATDSGDACFQFGEGATANLSWGVDWNWDSAYTFAWHARCSGTNRNLVWGYNVNANDYLCTGRCINMCNNSIHEINELAFTDSFRICDTGQSNKIYFCSGSANNVKIEIGTQTTGRGSLYANNGNCVGILDQGGDWAIIHYNDSYTAFRDTGGTERLCIGTTQIKSNEPICIAANWSDGTEPEAFTIQGCHPSLALRSTNAGSGNANLLHVDTGGHLNFYSTPSTCGAGSDAWSKRACISTEGRLWAQNCIQVNSSGCLRVVTGDYGSIEVDSGSTGGWEGYSIGGRMVFMHNNDTATGLYNDVDNEWLFYGIRNSYTAMYHNGTARIYTTNDGACINQNTGTGLQITGSGDEKINLSGSTNPYIRFEEGTNDKAYIQWHGGNGELKICNQEDSRGIIINSDLCFYNGLGNCTVWHAGNDGSGSGLDADLLDGVHLYQIKRCHSGSDFADGTKVLTSINASPTNGASFVIEVTGKSYSGSPPFSWIGQGYLYNNTIINCSAGDMTGHAPAYMCMFQDSTNCLAFWWPRVGYWHSFDVHVRDAGGSSWNTVTSITNAASPSGCSKQVCVPIRKSWTDFNDGCGSGLDADLLDGIQGASFLRSDADDTISCTLTFAKGATGNLAGRTGFSDFLGYNASYGSYIGGGVSNASRYLYAGGYFYDGSAVQTLWHTGNDGSGSGLDADLIDGIGFRNTGSNAGLNADTLASNGIVYYTAGVTNFSGNATDGALYAQAYSSSWQHQIAGDYRSGQIAVRGKNSGTWQSWRKVWDESNDGSGSGLDADLLDGQHGSYYQNASNLNAGTFPDLFNCCTRYNIGFIDGVGSSNRDKLRVYNSSSYTIGMQSGITFGSLNDWAMTFQMNSEDDRGFWWGDTAHTTAQGAMSLTTHGHLTVACRIKVGGGESTTTGPSYPLHVIGEGHITGNITTSGNVGIGTTDPGVYDLAVVGTSCFASNMFSWLGSDYTRTHYFCNSGNKLIDISAYDYTSVVTDFIGGNITISCGIEQYVAIDGNKAGGGKVTIRNANASSATITMCGNTGAVCATCFVGDGSNLTGVGGGTETSCTHSSYSGTTGITLDITHKTHVLPLASGAVITGFTYSNRSSSGTVDTITLVVKYSGTASITWTNVVWSGGVTPTLTGTSGKADVFVLTSYNGSYWIGTIAATNLNSTNL